MKTAHRALVFAAVVPALLGSGCYTVLKGPRVASDYLEEPTYSRYGSGAGNEDLLGARVGRTERDDDPYEDFYGGAPYGGTYGGYGTPVFGYDSRMGMFGGYRYGGYYPGAGPLGYGYDPYYSGAYGTYIPPGYELVTSNELYQLRTDANRNTTGPPPTTYEPPPDPVLQQRQAETQREVWQQRQETRQRPAPTLTPRPSASTTVTKSTATRSSSSSSSSSKGEEKETAKPKKRGR